MKVLYALVFVLFPLAASAQALDAQIIAEYYLDDISEEIIEHSAIPAPIIVSEPTIETLGEAMLEADGVVIAVHDDAEHFPAGEIQPSDENPTAPYPTRSNENVTMDDAIEQSTTAARIIATEPTIGTLGEAMLEVDAIATAAHDDAEDVRIGATQLSDEDSTAEYSTRSDNEPTLDGTIALMDGELGPPVE